MNLQELKKDLQKRASSKKASASQWFFKTKPGEYGAHDKFLGVTVPEQRLIAKKYRTLSLSDVLTLLKSPYHEHRLTAVFILVDHFARGDDKQKSKIVRQYLRHTKYINNWDIVDSSAPYILGQYLFYRPRKVLYKLARSKILWERRIAIIATQAFIRAGDFTDTLKIAKVLLHDPEDLIHKAAGWMVREVGDRDREVEKRFLNRFAPQMPRTMLRYAIEKFPMPEKKGYLARK